MCSIVLAKELRRKSKDGVFQPTEETITVGHPASVGELATNFILGFILGYKILGLLLLKNSLNVNPRIIFFRRREIFWQVLFWGRVCRHEVAGKE
ncbi:hypothetical protein LWM68_36105 [Niabella sp. W65]|nr:hypothetical protein [Niabella sp. W65]MCH7367699.1 hypothetical protein [Niabella sp. W65]